MKLDTFGGSSFGSIAILISSRITHPRGYRDHCPGHEKGNQDPHHRIRLAKLRGKKRATVALARRIGVVLHRMWRDGTEFRFTREEAMALQTA